MNKDAKTRYEQRVFVAEGLKLFLEAPKERVRGVYVSESFLESGGGDKIPGDCPYEIVSDRVFSAVSDTKTPQGILCLVEMEEHSLDGMAGEDALILALEDIRDPGNLGTMLRAGEGAGATGVILGGATVDAYHPKVVRAAMGSLFRVPFLATRDLPGCVMELRRRGVCVYAARLDGASYYGDPDYAGPTCFLIGNESKGLGEAVAGLADGSVRIPLEGRAESLNAAVAAALLLYEANRQRRAGKSL